MLQRIATGLAPCHICAGNALSPPHLRQDWAHPMPHLRWDWAHPAHICAGTARASVRRRQEEIQFIFDLLDEDSSGALSLAEFFDLVEVAQVGTW